MAMGIVSNEAFEKELERSEKEVKIPIVIPIERPGRKEGDNNVPDSLRKLIGEESVIAGRESALKLAEQFGVSPSSVSAYANGSKSTATMSRQPNLDFLRKRRERITRKASRALISSINKLTDEKLNEAKPAELATIARNMSAIVKEMEPEIDTKAVVDRPQFVVFSPQIRDERHFEIVMAKE